MGSTAGTAGSVGRASIQRARYGVAGTQGPDDRLAPTWATAATPTFGQGTNTVSAAPNVPPNDYAPICWRRIELKENVPDQLETRTMNCAES